MADAYLPALDAFVLLENEAAAVAAALETDKPWEWKPEDDGVAAALKSAKDKILTYHLIRHGWTCCYCRMNLHGAGPFMTDREHVLPKGKAVFKPYSYAMWNLAGACKRCNLQFKRSGDGFVVNKNNVAEFQSSENYRFVHPNFDRWEHHLTRISVQVNTKIIVHFIRAAGSHKAEYTYNFFGLRDLQVDGFDQAQGLATQGEESELAVLVRKIADDLDQ